jgi:hypothetical protein
MASLPLPPLGRLNARTRKARQGPTVGIGGAGNRMVGKKIVTNARHALGPAPALWPSTLRLLPPVHEAGWRFAHRSHSRIAGKRLAFIGAATLRDRRGCEVPHHLGRGRVAGLRKALAEQKD